MVYQNPGQALNPSIRVGEQVAEVYRTGGAHPPEAIQRAQKQLAKVQIAEKLESDPTFATAPAGCPAGVSATADRTWSVRRRSRMSG